MSKFRFLLLHFESFPPLDRQLSCIVCLIVLAMSCQKRFVMLSAIETSVI